MNRFPRSLCFGGWPLALFLACELLISGTVCLAQHHAGHRHESGQGVGGFRTSGPANFGGPGLVQQFGGGSYNYGGYQGSGAFNGAYNAPFNRNYGGFDANRPLGGVSFGNGFGTATYSSGNFGVTNYGLYHGGYGVVNYGIGYGPAIFSTPVYNYSPWVFGYGTGVFSPNFPSGNYITNGYVGYVPNGGYDPWCNPVLPYAVGMNSYFPGAGIAPTVLMLNTNLNIQPILNVQSFAPTASSYQMLDPRMIDAVAPAADPNGFNPNGAGDLVVPPPPMPPEPAALPLIPNEPQLPVQPDGAPVLNEFHAVPRDQKTSTLTEKIQSLRYQSSGDDAFHKSDYATADVFYTTAIKTAPDRRAPYLRMAMVRIALQDFPSAASYLKTGLEMESDASRPWFSVEELYGEKVAERTRSHGGPLWNWLAERPLSADRLLLAGTFQKLRGYGDVADQMLAMASHDGPEAKLVAEVVQLASADIGQRAISSDIEQLRSHAAASGVSPVGQKKNPSDERAVKQAGGIFMRGKNTEAKEDLSSTPQQLDVPMPIPRSQDTPITFEIPVQAQP
jgi:hypothetical protein